MDDYSVADSLHAWEANADFWDESMGDASNRFHREVVRPRVSELLDVQVGELILEAGCGNGNYAAWMAERGARVVAFDYSPRMIVLAKRRREKWLDRIDFRVADGTDEAQLMALAQAQPFDKVVSNMVLMDMTEVAPLFRCVSAMLREGGCFVFATQHPCFVTLTDRYLTPHAYRGEAIAGQPSLQCYYHRSLQDLLGLCFRSGLTVDGLYETCYGQKETPDVLIVRARKGVNG
ncbi:MAG: class I SAM-dependent methyltransferase [Eubacteriales bacterium]|nr:class I SAM-dependent methyltransferase [Eubacteriales bacterium]